MHSNKKIRKEDIEHKLSEIIEEYLPSNIEDFLQSGISKHGIYKLIESAIEDVIKICSMINSDLKLGIPSDEDSIIKNLEDNKIISGETANKIIIMKGFRNILVHRYGKLDDKQAFENISENLEDFEKFKKEILKFLNNY
ncbi:DUF86 domain-containing protein [Candidatus Pacearchaeota archaeon]|nr:DUF86 domain-containing protein [Candidatus Pacearchaeota archaeon]